MTEDHLGDLTVTGTGGASVDGDEGSRINTSFLVRFFQAGAPP